MVQKSGLSGLETVSHTGGASSGIKSVGGQWQVGDPTGTAWVKAGASQPTSTTTPRVISPNIQSNTPGLDVSLQSTMTPVVNRRTEVRATGTSLISESEYQKQQQKKEEAPGLIGSLIPGFRAAKKDFLIESRREKEIETERLTDFAKFFGEARAKQEVAKLSKERDVTEVKLEKMAQTSQARIESIAEQLTSKVQKGDITLIKAEKELEVFTQRERSGFESRLGEEQELLKIKSLRATEDINKEVGIVLAPEITKATGRLQSNIDKATLGIGAFTPDVFIAKKAGLGKVSQKMADIAKLEREFAANIVEGKTTFKEPKSALGRPLTDIDVTVARGKRIAGQVTSIDKDLSKFLGVAAVETSASLTQIGAGVVKRPVTVGTSALLAFSITGLAARFAPAIALKAAQGSKTAANIITGAKIGKAVLITGFVGERVISTTVAGLTQGRVGVEDQLGKTIAIGGGAIIGGVVGSKVGGALFQRSLLKAPSITKASVTQIGKGKGEISFKVKGSKIQKGFKIDFKAKGAEVTSGTKVTSITDVSSQFLGKQLPNVRTTFTGRVQGVVGTRAPKGAVQFVMGKTTGTGFGGQKLDFTVFGDKTITGTTGKTTFTSKITGIKEIKPGVNLLKITETTPPKVTFRLGASLREGAILPAKILTSTTSVGTRSVFKPRGEITTGKTTTISRPITITGSTAISPVVLQGIVGGLAIPTPTPTILFPSVGRIGGGRAASITPSISKVSIEPISFAGFKGVTEVGIGAIPDAGSAGIPGVGAGVATGTDVGVLSVGTTSTSSAPSFTISPRIPTPTSFKFPFIFPPGGGGSGRSFTRLFGTGRVRGKYQPSLVASAFNIRGKKKKLLSGLEIRPIVG